MAEIPQVYLDCAVYLYPSEADAASGNATGGGTAFIVVVPMGGWNQLYIVTAAHVIQDGTAGASQVVRINSEDGKFQLFPANYESWKIDEKNDLAIMPIEIPAEGLNYGVIPMDGFLTKEMIEHHKFGPGNEVFITGRFVKQEGIAKNTPTVRFGNISLMPFEPFKRSSKEEENLEEVFLVEFRSVGGYSGSPVFLCEIPFHLRFRGTSHQILSYGPHLLGVDVGHVHDWKLVKKSTDKGMEDEKPKRYYEMNTAMSVIVPAWKLLALLNREDVMKLREPQEIEGNPTSGYSEDSAKSDAADIFTQQDFESDLRKVTRRVGTSESDEGTK